MGKFKENNGKTRVGVFLNKIKDISPTILNTIGTVTGVSQLNTVASLIKNDQSISSEDREVALELIKIDIVEMQEVSNRWSNDMNSDSWLSKNVRPIALIFLTLFMTFIIFSDSKEYWNFDVKESYISLLETLLVVVYAAYFGSRGAEKIQKIKKS